MLWRLNAATLGLWWKNDSFALFSKQARHLSSPRDTRIKRSGQCQSQHSLLLSQNDCLFGTFSTQEAVQKSADHSQRACPLKRSTDQCEARGCSERWHGGLSVWSSCWSNAAHTLVYKQQTPTSHTYGGQKSATGVPTRPGSGFLTTDTSLRLHMVEGERELPGVPFMRSLVPPWGCTLMTWSPPQSLTSKCCHAGFENFKT